jgi:RNA polymerase sigma-70 factor (ECF subfamily)
VSADPTSGTDQELLEATRAGDENAFVEIYRRHRDRIYRFAYRMTGSAEAAHDVTWLSWDCSSLPLRRPTREPGLCGTARHLSLRRASRAWRERSLAALPALRPAPLPSPLEALLEDERARVVREALAALAPLHREVLILAEYEDLDLGTIAQIVGVEVGAVKVRLHRARRKLRAALEAHMRSGTLMVD